MRIIGMWRIPLSIIKCWIKGHDEKDSGGFDWSETKCKRCGRRWSVTGKYW